MIEADVIEEHPINEPAPWITISVVAPKPDNGIRITLDARNVNKAIQSNNHPIPRPDDIKAQLVGSIIFSKMDFKSAFFQLELAPESRCFTTFHGNGKLYRYKRLTMRMKPSQGELNTALSAIFAYISQAHLLHNDLIIAAQNQDEHIKALEQGLQATQEAGLILNPGKCEFGRPEIKFWGMIVSSDGIQHDPCEVDALKYLSIPKDKSELNPFLCMMQANGKFIPNFAKLMAPLRKLLKKNERFIWTTEHDIVFKLFWMHLRTILFFVILIPIKRHISLLMHMLWDLERFLQKEFHWRLLGQLHWPQG